MRVAIGAGVAALLAVVVLSQQPAAGADPIIDSWPVGPGSECQGAACDALVRAAVRGLDERNPGHAAVTSAEVHAEGAFSDALTGRRYLIVRSGIGAAAASSS